MSFAPDLHVKARAQASTLPAIRQVRDFVRRSSVRQRYRSRTTSALASAAAFVLEGELQLGAVGRDLALLDDQVLLEDLGDAQVAQRFGGAIDRRLCRQLPGLAAGADELDHLVDAVRHGYLPRHGFTVSSGAGSGGGAATVPERPFVAVEPNTNQAVANLPNSQCRPGAAANSALV